MPPEVEGLPKAWPRRLLAWQRQHGRHHLPWQGTRDPYRVWLSEVMLQQTQVGTVLGYYARFLARFDDVAALADAPLDEVLALWSGLGYYSRARHLHACALTVVRDHGGVFPASAAELERLPGIGRSTAAAIAAFCHGERVPILDGNVKRVLTRALGFDGDLAERQHEHRLWQLAGELLPRRGTDMPAYTQGLMDLGAEVCLARNPRCDACPLAADCVARAQGRPQDYPVKTRRLKRSQRRNVVLLLRQGGRLLMVRRPAQGVWAALWCAPVLADVPAFEKLAADWPGEGRALATIDHALTHLDWRLEPWLWTLPARLPAGRRTAIEATLVGTQLSRWTAPAEALALGLPAPIRKLIESL